MTDDQIAALFAKVNETHTRTAVLAEQISGLREQVLDIRTKQDRAFWFSLTQAVALAVGLLMLIIGAVK